MKDIRRAQELIGSDVFDRHGDRIGRVDNVYVDDATDQPEWITVRAGLLSSRQTFVPLAGARRGDGGISVCVSRTKVKRAPRIQAKDGHLSNSEGHDLYRHYGIQRGIEDRTTPRARMEASQPAMPTAEEQTMPGGITLQPPDEP